MPNVRFPGAAAWAAVLAITASTLSMALPAQDLKRPITHQDYDAWPSIQNSTLSVDGKWIAYAVNPAWGDGELVVAEIDGDKEYRHARGDSPRFSANGRYVVFVVKKSVEKERREKIAKLHGGKAKELEATAKSKEQEARAAAEARRAAAIARVTRGPRGSRGRSRGGRDRGELAILDLTNGKVEMIGKIHGYRLDRDGKHLFYQPNDEKKAKEPNKQATSKKTAKKPTESEGELRTEGRRGTSQGSRRRARGSARSRGPRRGVRGSAGNSGDARTNADKGGNPLVIRNLATGTEQRFEGIQSYSLHAKDKWLTLVSKFREEKREPKRAAPGSRPLKQEGSKGDKKTRVSQDKVEKLAAPAKPNGIVLPDGLHAMELDSGNRVTLVECSASYRGFTTDSHDQKLAFTSNVVDTLRRKAEKKERERVEKEKREKAKKEKGETRTKNKKEASPKKSPKDAKNDPRNDIYLWDFDKNPARRLITADSKGIPPEAKIQPSGLSFSDDGTLLAFGIKRKDPPKLPDILPEERVVVDIWHWQDGHIQPAQAKQARRNKNPTLSCAWHLASNRAVVLGDKDLPSVRLITRDGSRAMATSSKPYERLQTWDGLYSDTWLINTIDGTRRLIKKKARTRLSASPSGRWLTWFGPDYQWYIIDVDTLEERHLSKEVSLPLHNVLEDRPQPARSYGIAGWGEGEDYVFIYDRYDLWKINVKTCAASCVTDGYGRANKVVLRYTRFDLEGDDDDLDPWVRQYIPANILLNAKNDVTKARCYFTDSTVELQKPKQLVMVDASLGGLRRAKKADRLMFSKSTFAEFPDLWVSDLEFEDMRKVTDACELQKQVRWGKAELVNWTNHDGTPLQGYLVKPDGFDPRKKYPMMVYFYERNADNIHRYSGPRPGTSPNAAYYVSNGYLWFVPDIVYTVGYPGESAEKCVISGVQHLLDQGFVDRKAIGCAGHSWGGYQTAHLVTRTNLFAAAESGAPVSNMFSAYGGIRYQSGRSRQFQYERTQSRIGGTPWQYPQRYWQNSPLFYADRVKTPVLILHNDGDGAVPWTNGIEFFMALRRLDKEAYLFNYNGEPHGLRKRQNQKDWARRMAQFFDHHLKGAPAADWMKNGVRYVDREREKIQWAPSFIEANKKRKVRTAAAEEDRINETKESH